MTHYTVETDLSPADALEKAAAYLGKLESGLNIIEASTCCVQLAGPNGHLSVTALAGERTRLEIDATGWEREIAELIGQYATLSKR
ncbi:MAG: hypothetical protein ACYC4R_06775 [Anaerolineae bacterium]